MKKGMRANTQRNYKYYGLGFLVILEEVTYDVVDGEKCYDIDMKNIRDAFLYFLMTNHQIDILGGMIKLVRTSRGLTIDEFAEKIGVASKGTISKWEKEPEQIIKLNNHQLLTLKTQVSNFFMEKMQKQVAKILDNKKAVKQKEVKSKPITISRFLNEFIAQDAAFAKFRF